MRFEPANCPQCGQQAKGTLETVPGVALLMFDEDGNAEYQGQTDLCWDDQETIRDESGRATLFCPGGHDWLAEMAGNDDPGPVPPPNGDPT